MNSLPPAGTLRVLAQGAVAAPSGRPTPAAAETAAVELDAVASASKERLARVVRYREADHAEAAFSYSRTAELRSLSSRGGLVDLHA